MALMAGLGGLGAASAATAIEGSETDASVPTGFVSRIGWSDDSSESSARPHGEATSDPSPSRAS
jgi:hypothetical protein